LSLAVCTSFRSLTCYTQHISVAAQRMIQVEEGMATNIKGKKNMGVYTRLHEYVGFIFIFLSHFRSLSALTVHASFPATETGTLFIHYRSCIEAYLFEHCDVVL
jgi:hypothetical protein